MNDGDKRFIHQKIYIKEHQLSLNCVRKILMSYITRGKIKLKTKRTKKLIIIGCVIP